MNLIDMLRGNPMSGIGLAGNPLSGIGLAGGGGFAGPMQGAGGGLSPEDEKKKKKEGIASMLSGIGKGHDKGGSGLQMPQQQGFDIQGLLASLFGG